MSVYRADVSGDKHTGLILLYAKLSTRSIDGDYLPANWTLETAHGPGSITRLRISKGDLHPFILRIANLNGLPGDEITVQPYEISSGDPETIYALNAGSIRAVGTFSAGGDSVDQSSFSCQNRPTPRITQDVGMTDASNIFTGTWKWTATTYVWHGATLKRGKSRTFERRGIRSIASKRAWGAGCGTLVGNAGDE